MIGFDFPIRPEWVHDVHLMIEPNMLISELTPVALKGRCSNWTAARHE